MILITGGAGYIGSHVVQTFLNAPEQVIVMDNLSSGQLEAMQQAADYVVADINDVASLERIFTEYPIEGIIHLAALTEVGLSVIHPEKFYQANTAASMTLLEAAIRHQVKYFIFSSTAAVYGEIDVPAVTEEMRCAPINPYGASKLMFERILADCANAHNMKYINLRYFNAGGADPHLNIGPYNRHSSLLMRVVAQAAIGVRDHVKIFGTDYPTPDGTGIRDYVHVCDIADIHLHLLNYLRQGGDSCTLNCGYGHGYSVKQIIDCFRDIAKRDIAVEYHARRTGDPAIVVAANQKLQQLLNWQPKYADLTQIVAHTLAWEKKLWGVSDEPR